MSKRDEEILTRLLQGNKIDFAQNYKSDIHFLRDRITELERERDTLLHDKDTDKDNLIGFVRELHTLLSEHGLSSPIPCG